MTIVGVNRIALTKTADGWLKLIEVDVFGQIPAAAQTAAKKSIVDMIGVMTPPSSLDTSCQRLFDFAKSESNGGDCSFVGFGEKGSAMMAAFINGCCV